MTHLRNSLSNILPILLRNDNHLLKNNKNSFVLLGSTIYELMVPKIMSLYIKCGNTT